MVRVIEVTASCSTDYLKYITPNSLIKHACTKNLVHVRRVCETYSWQLSQVASTSEISDSTGHACTTRSICSPIENDEHESTKKIIFHITMPRRLPASRRPLKGGRAATKEPPRLHSLNNILR